jgi:hypothetical protein
MTHTRATSPSLISSSQVPCISECTGISRNTPQSAAISRNFRRGWLTNRLARFILMFGKVKVRYQHDYDTKRIRGLTQVSWLDANQALPLSSGILVCVQTSRRESRRSVHYSSFKIGAGNRAKSTRQITEVNVQKIKAGRIRLSKKIVAQLLLTVFQDLSDNLSSCYLFTHYSCCHMATSSSAVLFFSTRQQWVLCGGREDTR